MDEEFEEQQRMGSESQEADEERHRRSDSHRQIIKRTWVHNTAKGGVSLR